MASVRQHAVSCNQQTKVGRKESFNRKGKRFEEDTDPGMSREKKPSTFKRFVMNFTSVLGIPVYKTQRARQLGKVPPPACFQDERLDDESGTPLGFERRAYSLGAKERKRRSKKPRVWRRRGKQEWESNYGHRVALNTVDIRDLCDAEIKVLQEIAIGKLNKLDFTVSSGLIKVLNQLSTPRTKVQRRSFRKKNQQEKDQGIVFGQPLSKVAYQSKSNRIRRMSSPYLLPTSTPQSSASLQHSSASLQPNSTPLQSDQTSMHSFSSNSVLSDSPPTTPNPNRFPAAPSSSDSHLRSVHQLKSLSSSRIQDIPSLGTPLSQINSPGQSTFTFETDTSSFSLADSSYQDEEGTNLSPRSERKMYLTPSSPMMPEIIQKSIDYLKSKGILTEGIFRISGAKSRIKQIREHFDKGLPIAWGDDINPHDVACLLKEYLRCLPEPLISRELYSYFLQTQKIETRSTRRDVLRSLCLLLPKANRDTLRYLLQFLNQVALHSNDIILIDGTEEQGNKMSEENLGMIFGPNILHKRKVRTEYGGMNKGEQEDVVTVCRVIEDLIKMEGSLFTIPKELLDEAMDRMLQSDPKAADYLFRKKCNMPGFEFEEDESVFDLTEVGNEIDGQGYKIPFHRSKSSEILRYRVAELASLEIPNKELSSHQPDHNGGRRSSREYLRTLHKEGSRESSPLLRTSRERLYHKSHGSRERLNQPTNGDSKERSYDVVDSGSMQNLDSRPVVGTTAKQNAPVDDGIEDNISPQVNGTCEGGSPIRANHNRMNSQSSNSSVPITTAHNDNGNNRGSDSAFSYTNSSLNPDSRSSSECIVPPPCGNEGHVSAAPPPQQPDSVNSSNQTSPDAHGEEVQNSSSQPSQSAHGEEVQKRETAPLQKQLSFGSSIVFMKFQEIESKVAELDSQVSLLQNYSVDPSQSAPPAPLSGKQDVPQLTFSELDSHFEQLTSELSMLNSFSPQPEDGFKNQTGHYSSLPSSSRHGLGSARITSSKESNSPGISVKVGGNPDNLLQGSSSAKFKKARGSSPGRNENQAESNSSKSSLHQESSIKQRKKSNQSWKGSSNSLDKFRLETGIVQHGPERVV